MLLRKRKAYGRSHIGGHNHKQAKVDKDGNFVEFPLVGIHTTRLMIMNHLHSIAQPIFSVQAKLSTADVYGTTIMRYGILV